MSGYIPWLGCRLPRSIHSRSGLGLSSGVSARDRCGGRAPVAPQFREPDTRHYSASRRASGWDLFGPSRQSRKCSRPRALSGVGDGPRCLARWFVNRAVEAEGRSSLRPERSPAVAVQPALVPGSRSPHCCGSRQRHQRGWATAGYQAAHLLVLTPVRHAHRLQSPTFPGLNSRWAVTIHTCVVGSRLGSLCEVFEWTCGEGEISLPSPLRVTRPLLRRVALFAVLNRTITTRHN